LSGQHYRPGKRDNDLESELRRRLEQQAVIADLSMKALSGTNLLDLMDEAARRVREAFECEFTKISQLQDDGMFLVVAGSGWPDGVVGHARFGVDSPAGYTVQKGQNIVVADLQGDNRFKPPELLQEHGVVSELSVSIRLSTGFWGAFGVDSTSPQHFDEHDLNFVQVVANIIGDSVERMRNEEAHAQLAAVVESSYDAIFRKTTEGIITSWNAAAQRMYGYTHDEAVGRRVDELLIPAERSHEFGEIMEQVLSGKSTGSMETERVAKDGSRIAISLTVSPIRDGYGRVIAASTIAHDITEQKRAQEELRRAHDELEQRVEERTLELQNAIEELESFTYAVSHDLRAPLRSVNGFAQALIEDCGDQLDDIGTAYLQRIQMGARRMGTLIDDLLNLSRLSHTPVQLETFDLAPVAQRLVNDLKEREPDRSAEFHIPESLEATADRDLLGILLTNLLDNAWKYTRPQGHSRIEIGTEEQDGRQVIFVSDNGIGFDERYSDKLFAPFQRLHTREVEGTGIGLATVARIINRHGGEIWAKSSIGEGSTFYFTLSPKAKRQQSQKPVKVSAST